MRIAVLSDIHGNAWALEAVLAELADSGVHRVWNLGDCFFGPLDPRRTREILLRHDWPTVRGNQDRALLEEVDAPQSKFTLSEIGKVGREWLRERTRPTVRSERILACHGTPERDDVTLIERVEPTGEVRASTGSELTEALAGAGDAELVLCGHSHRPGTLALPDGRLVVNPGSVGLPAYTADEPHPHAMEAGTPHARWATLERTGAGWIVELRATPYDSAAAASAARANGRPDWARWIETGRAAVRETS